MWQAVDEFYMPLSAATTLRPSISSERQVDASAGPAPTVEQASTLHFDTPPGDVPGSRVPQALTAEPLAPWCRSIRSLGHTRGNEGAHRRDRPPTSAAFGRGSRPE